MYDVPLRLDLSRATSFDVMAATVRVIQNLGSTYEEENIHNYMSKAIELDHSGVLSHTRKFVRLIDMSDVHQVEDY